MKENNNIIDYIMKYRDVGFEQMEFNTVDSMILTQLSYLKFESVLPCAAENNKHVTLGSLFDNDIIEKLVDNIPSAVNNMNLFAAASTGARFCGIEIIYYDHAFHAGDETQFFAMTFKAGDFLYVAFRGTDATLVGWKEDFNMAFTDIVPSQLKSVDYLNKTGEMTKGDIVVGGHSKGGNLAVYSSLFCREDIKERISRIYCFDGPGFRNGLIGDIDCNDINRKIYRYIPQSSVIGMLMQNLGEYNIVESNRFWIFQHDLFTWRINGRDFKYADSLSDSSLIMDEAMNLWLNDIDDDSRRNVIDAVYKVLSSTNAVTITDITFYWRENAKTILNSLDNIDPELKQYMSKVIKSLFNYSIKVYRERRNKVKTD